MIPVIIEIHAEPDDHYLNSGNVKDWIGFEQAVSLLRVLRRSASRLKLTWLFRTDPQIGQVYGHNAWALKQYQDAIYEFESLGDEMGIHIHPYRFEEGRTIAQDFDDVNHLVATADEAVQAFKSVLQYIPKTIATTLGCTNTTLVNHFRLLGLKYDLSLNIDAPEDFPKHLGPFIGTRSSGKEFPRKIYCPSFSEYSKEDLNRSDYYMIPIQCWKFPAYVNLKNMLGRTLRREPLYKIGKPSLGMLPKHFRKIVRESIRTKSYMVISSRSDIFKDQLKYERIRENISYLLEEDQVQFVTPKNWVPGFVR